MIQEKLENLIKIYPRTGISLQNLEKELILIEFIPKFFNKLEENNIKAILYGGTALNKGYLKERQRFSKDLDIYIIENSPGRVKEKFQEKCKRITKILNEIEYDGKNYDVEIIHLGRDKAAWQISYGKEKWQNLIIEAERKTENKAENSKKSKGIKIVNLELHSLLEYAGLPIPPVYVKSAPLEYILAGKIVALSRRAIGKDIYDVEAGLKLEFDVKELKADIEDIAKEKVDKIIDNALYWLEKVNVNQPDIAELRDTIPLEYRKDVKTIIESLKYELKKLKEK